MREKLPADPPASSRGTSDKIAPEWASLPIGEDQPGPQNLDSRAAAMKRSFAISSGSGDAISPPPLALAGKGKTTTDRRHVDAASDIRPSLQPEGLARTQRKEASAPAVHAKGRPSFGSLSPGACPTCRIPADNRSATHHRRNHPRTNAGRRASAATWRLQPFARRARYRPARLSLGNAIRLATAIGFIEQARRCSETCTVRDPVCAVHPAKLQRRNRDWPWRMTSAPVAEPRSPPCARPSDPAKFGLRDVVDASAPATERALIHPRFNFSPGNRLQQRGAGWTVMRLRNARR